MGTKISALPNRATVQDTDLLVVADSDEGTNYKTSVSEFISGKGIITTDTIDDNNIVTSTTNSLTWEVELSTGGGPFTPTAYQRAFLINPAFTVGNVEQRFLEATPIVVPQLQTKWPNSDSIVHPCVIDTATTTTGGWNGYRYWMSLTPLAWTGSALDSSTENPVVLASHDGITFVNMSGTIDSPTLANPTWYFSDPYLQLAPDRSALLLIYRQSTGTAEKIWLTTSVDGRIWTAPVLLITSASTVSFLSPSLIFNGSTWELWTNQANEGYFNKFSAPTLLGAWTGPVTVTPTLPSSETDIWHSEIRRNPNGSYYGVVQCGQATWPARIYLFTSTDGTGATFTFSPILNEGSLGYKSSFVPQIAENGAVGGKLYLEFQSGNDNTTLYNGDSIYVIPVRFNANAALDRALTLDMACTVGAPTSRILLADNFIRANSAVSLGSAKTGQAWTNAAGTFGISSNKAYCPTPAQVNLATIDVGAADYYAELTVGTPGTDAASFSHLLTVRYLDANNLIRFGQASTAGVANLYATSYVGGVQTLLFSNVNRKLWRQIASGDRIGVYCKGSKIRFFYNGTLVGTIDGSLWPVVEATKTATKIGIQHVASLTSSLFNSLIVQAV